MHTSTAPTSANEQHCRRWIGTPNCATFAAHKAGRLQALVDQSSSRIGRQEDRMHQATVSEIAVSCLAPRASVTNDIARKNFSYFGSATSRPGHAAEVAVVFPARRLRHGVVMPRTSCPRLTRETSSPARLTRSAGGNHERAVYAFWRQTNCSTNT